ncbi:MAG: hypothetical protein ACLUDH_11725 [Faecalispora sporosphaeroides]|uniref:Uncharacterized protein n=1 Tax=Faecalispora sporosphaeroides TaxID=1549 RepID=A0A928KTP4_9FIRM|nr:hypothetical protein [Faecalispora sporosphaeroides]MBE6834502.1 hypothetical protein [Faecalispora sporosphaeroides]
MKRLLAVCATAALVVSSAAAVRGWGQYRQCFPRPVLLAKEIDSPEDLDLLDGPTAILASERSLRGPGGLFYRASLFFANQMISVRGAVIRHKQTASKKRGS